ncbi:MAG TPA: hypothetical protein VFZ40_20165 [Pyrinomonadaceae bacterium]
MRRKSYDVGRKRVVIRIEIIRQYRTYLPATVKDITVIGSNWRSVWGSLIWEK